MIRPPLHSNPPAVPAGCYRCIRINRSQTSRQAGCFLLGASPYLARIGLSRWRDSSAPSAPGGAMHFLYATHFAPLAPQSCRVHHDRARFRGTSGSSQFRCLVCPSSSNRGQRIQDTSSPHLSVRSGRRCCRGRKVPTFEHMCEKRALLRLEFSV